MIVATQELVEAMASVLAERNPDARMADSVFFTEMYTRDITNTLRNRMRRDWPSFTPPQQRAINKLKFMRVGTDGFEY